MPDNTPSLLKNPEMIVAISAVVIGACALLLAFFEVRIMRADQRASVLPVLELSRSFSRNDNPDDPVARIMFSAENVGTGPAKVETFRVTVDGEPHDSWRSAIRALISKDIDYGQSTIRGRTIPPGRLIQMFTLADPGLATEIYAQFDRLDYAACFCSVYGECWTTSYHRFGTVEPASRCTQVDGSFTE